MLLRIKTSPLLMTIVVAGLLGGCTPHYVVRSYNDPFEGPTRGYVLYLDRSHLTAVGGRVSRAGHELELLIVDGGQHDATVPAGTPVELLVGGDILQIPTAQESGPVSNVFGYGVITQWKLVLSLSPDQVAMLARMPLTAARVMIAGETYTLALNPEQQAVVQRNTNTLLSGPSPGS